MTHTNIINHAILWCYLQNSVDAPKKNSDQTERCANMKMPVIANNQATTVVHPAKGALNLPALPVGWAYVDRMSPLRVSALASLVGRDGRLDASAAHITTQFSTVLGISWWAVFIIGGQGYLPLPITIIVLIMVHLLSAFTAIREEPSAPNKSRIVCAFILPCIFDPLFALHSLS